MASTVASKMNSRLVLLTVILLTVVLIASLSHWFDAGLVDDGYIFLRYAENLGQGNGLVFNTGERVEGFSSPLWTLLLAVAGSAMGDLEVAARLLGVVTVLAVVAVLLLGVLRWSESARPMDAGVLTIGAAALPPVVYYSVSGMDHPIFAASISAALVSAVADHRKGELSVRTSLLLIMSTLARSEGVLVAAWIGCHFLLAVRDRSFSSRLRATVPFVSIYAAGVIALQMARWFYFGVILPNTFYAKVTPDTWSRLGRGLTYLAQCLIAFSPLIAVGAAIGFLAWRSRRFPTGVVTLLAGWIVLWCGYIVWTGGDHFPMYRLSLPMLPAMVLLVGILWSEVYGKVSGSNPWVRIGVLAAVMVATLVLCQRSEGDRARREPRLAAKWALRGQWLADHTPPDTLVAATNIGAIGYFSSRRIVDLMGLVDATVARGGTVASGAAPGHARYHTDYVFSRTPDLVVYYRTGSPRDLGRAFTPPDFINRTYAYALFDFVRDPRCAELYEQVISPLHDGSVIEMQKRREFDLEVEYAVAPWSR